MTARGLTPNMHKAIVAVPKLGHAAPTHNRSQSPMHRRSRPPSPMQHVGDCCALCSDCHLRPHAKEKTAALTWPREKGTSRPGGSKGMPLRKLRVGARGDDPSRSERTGQAEEIGAPTLSQLPIATGIQSRSITRAGTLRPRNSKEKYTSEANQRCVLKYETPQS